MKMKIVLGLFLVTLMQLNATAQNIPLHERQDRISLDSREGNGGAFIWKMMRSTDLKDQARSISSTGFNCSSWQNAIVPGTVLQSLVHNKVYPDPYFGVNNKVSSNIIPDISAVGRDFYTYWFRTEFNIGVDYKSKNIWLQLNGINYRAEIWLNGVMVGNTAGMFKQEVIDVTDFAKVGEANALAIKVLPVDIEGTNKPKPWRARGENRNGGDGNIGLNTTMLMTVGWDFTFKDGIRDRNTGIWRSIELFSTNKIMLKHPFVSSAFTSSKYDQASETVSVTVANAAMKTVKCLLKGDIDGKVFFEKPFMMVRGEESEVKLASNEFPQLIMKNPSLWWPVNKGQQQLHDLHLKLYVDGEFGDSISTKFGIREIRVDRNSPDSSKIFYVNGKAIFIRGSNWIPEAMLQESDKRMLAELKYTRKSGINMLRLWGGGIAESDYFYQLCDEYGILVWQEFWMTGDTKHPQDRSIYFNNLESSIKRIRNHPSLAFYVGSNEGTDVTGTKNFIRSLDETRPYQMQSEIDGVHDGSPYQQVNPMQHYENTASSRGSRIDGFNPEYGAPSLPIIESLREMMPEKDLWPINKDVWDYMDGAGFHLMTTKYKELTDNYGVSNSIDEFAKKGQLVAAMNSKSIWETWNRNKFSFGDRFASGLLFWYHNSPNQQVCARMWDWSLEPTASLYHTQHALEPLHVQFDYLKNTVSVYNDLMQSFDKLQVKAEVYDISSKRISSYKKEISHVDADAVINDVIKLDFPASISKVHFIKLTLQNDQGSLLSSNFYWRSTDAYLGKETMTGPAASGFESLASMKAAKVEAKTFIKDSSSIHRISVEIKNSSSQIAFFTQVKLMNEANKMVKPALYSDNFFSLLSKENKTIEIEVDASVMQSGNYHLVIAPYNGKELIIPIPSIK